MSTVIPVLSVGSLIEAFNTLFTRRIPLRHGARLRHAAPGRRSTSKRSGGGTGWGGEVRAAASLSHRCPKSKAADKSAVKQFTIAVIQCASCLRCSESKPTWVIVECVCCGGCHFIHLHFASLAVRGEDYSQTKVKFYVLAVLPRPAIIHPLLYPLQIN